MNKHNKLNQFGFDHVFLAVACFVIVGIIGTTFLVASHALTTQWKGSLEAFGNGSGFCTTAAGSTSGSKVVLDPCSKATNSYQVWSLNDIKTATIMGQTGVQEFTFQTSAGNNECLNNPYGSKKAGTQLQVYTCNSNDNNSLWIWGAKFSGSKLTAHQLINVGSVSDNIGLCMDDAYSSESSGTKIQLYKCNFTGQSNQNWFESTTSAGAGNLVHYVALGDSVAAGEGINYGWVYQNGDWKQTGPQNPIWEPTTDLTATTQDCHRSAQAYPYLIASSTSFKLLDLSCSGASIPAGILGPVSFGGSTTGPAQLGSNLSMPGYSPPNAAYDSFKPNLVTITLGMDDIDFSDILSNCYTGACGTTSQNQSVDVSISTFSNNLKTVLKQIDSRGTADGKVPWVVLTTYYDPFNTNSLSCGDIDIGLGFGLNSTDVNWLQSKLNLVNQDIISDSASYPKAKIVNLSTIMNGHQFCSSSPWVYGPSILFNDINSPAPFHPTPSGQQAIANQMLNTIKTIDL